MGHACFGCWSSDCENAIFPRKFAADRQSLPLIGKLEKRKCMKLSPSACYWLKWTVGGDSHRTPHSLSWPSFLVRRKTDHDEIPHSDQENCRPTQIFVERLLVLSHSTAHLSLFLRSSSGISTFVLVESSHILRANPHRWVLSLAGSRRVKGGFQTGLPLTRCFRWLRRLLFLVTRPPVLDATENTLYAVQVSLGCFHVIVYGVRLLLDVVKLFSLVK